MSDEELHTMVSRLHPELQLQIRGALEPGLSGASVRLVNFRDGEGQRLGVLKLTSAEKAANEADAYERARTSWLGGFLPDYVFRIELGTGDEDALLISLARDRLENCQTLRKALLDSYPYGRETILAALSESYRREAARHWDGLQLTPIGVLFRQLTTEVISGAWMDTWTKRGLPADTTAFLILEDCTERWPNPIALLAKQELWPADFKVSVPCIFSHGDLNERNVLCPTVDRYFSTPGAVPRDAVAALKQISMIDPPFCRKLPFTFDLAFLTTWLRFLLPGFENRVARDITLQAYRSTLEFVRTENRPQRCPTGASKFVECFETIFQPLLQAQPRMADDIKQSFLVSLASAALCQAIRFGSRKEMGAPDRAQTVDLLCLSSLSLRELLGARIPREVAGNDTLVRVFPEGPARTAWTAAASKLGELIASCQRSRNLILVLGREWNVFLGLPTDRQVVQLRQSEGQNLSSVAATQQPTSTTERLGPLGALPLTAVFDWCVSPHIRQALGKRIPPPRFIRPVVPPGTDATWSDHNAVFYFHLRGSLDLDPTIALKAPERNVMREKIREGLGGFSRRRAGDLVILYVGLDLEDLKETHAFLHSIWKQNVS